MAHQAQWPGVIHHAAEDMFDQDMRRAIAESLATHNGQHQQTPWHSGSSPEAEPDDDADLQRALALSMQTYEAEQLQPQTEAPAPGQPNKRSHSPSPAERRPQGPQPTNPDTALAKRQRSSSAQVPPQDAGTAALLALQELAARAGADALLALHHASEPQHQASQQQQQALHHHQQQQQQQQDPEVVEQGSFPATCQHCDKAATAAPPPAAAAGSPAAFGLGRSGSVKNLDLLAGGTAGGGPTDLGGVDDLGLYDWSDTVSGSGIGGGSGAADDAGARGTYDHVVDQGRWHQPQQVLLQLLQQQQQVVLAGRGSKVRDVGARRLYQQGEPVWWTDPLTWLCHPASIFGADTSALPAQPGAERRYIIDVQQYAVRYVEANTSQLLPQLYPGDLVWCKPAMAIAQQFNVKDVQQQQQQQQQQALAAQASGVGAGRDPWFVAPWALGVVEISKLHNGVPVLQVKLSSGGSCWFPVMHVDKVTEAGESSSAAEARALQNYTVAAEHAPAPAAVNDSDVTQKQQQQPQQDQQQQHVQQQQAHRLQEHQAYDQQQQHGQCSSAQDAAADNRSGPAAQHMNEDSAGHGSTSSVQLDGLQKDFAAMDAPVVAALLPAAAAPRQQSERVTALPSAAAATAAGPAVHEEVGDSAELLHQLEGAGDSLELCAADAFASKGAQ